ncbi:phosphoethanolamine transferase [Dialister hominis]|uniref:phosphoethanolamine transferase n=1 Tax=Dialister hominis TaxID=2582419 RepID=UPI003AF0B61B
MNKNINNNSEVNSIRARAKQLFLYSGISFLFTLTLWCWFAFSHIAYLSAWNLSLRDAFITFFIISLLQLIVEANITKQIWHAAYPGFLATMIVFPYVIGAGSGNGIPDFQYLNPYVLASVGIATVTVILTHLQRKAGRIPAFLISFFILALMIYQIIASLVYLGYYLTYGSTFAPADFLPIVQTRWSEAMGFISAFISIKTLILGIVLLGLLFIPSISLVYSGYLNHNSNHTPQRRLFLIIELLFLITGILLAGRWIPRCFPAYDYRVSQKYIHSIQIAKDAHARNAANLTLTNPAFETLANRVPGTVLLIIGESETKDIMHAFTPSYPVDTTPWLSNQKSSPNFFLFDNAYTNFPATARALTMALTGVNQYNWKQINEVANLMDVAKKAGYDTWWISNHNQMGGSNSGVELVSDTADHDLWTKPAESPDESMLSLLQQVPKDGNHFIVLHIMGSHTKYTNRIPSSFHKITVPGKTQNEIEYANTVAYTDHVLKEFYNYSKDNLHLAAMVYLSDHGEDMTYGHGGGHITWQMLHIPFFIYLSPAYEQEYPDTARILRSNEKKIFTNDLLFDTMSGLLKAPNSDYDARFDISSSSYDLPSSEALSVWKERKISEDPSINT